MEKNGGSCAGKRRFGVFVISLVSMRALVMLGTDPGAGFPARRRRAAGGRSRRRTGGHRRQRKKETACVDSWPAVTALAADRRGRKVRGRRAAQRSAPGRTPNGRIGLLLKRPVAVR